jgi:preprotein translocase subunit SecE
VAKSATRKKLQDNAVVDYLRETWFELKKVSWPSRSEAVNLTIIVILVMSFLSIVLSIMDYVFSTGFGLILG